jgi:hypothetical protein
VTQLINDFTGALVNYDKGGSGKHGDWEGRHIGMCKAAGEPDSGCKVWYSNGGIVGVPVKQGDKVKRRWYTYGAFIDGVELPCGGEDCPEDVEVNEKAKLRSLAEMLRPAIRSAMTTW